MNQMYESTTVNAPVATVWATIRNFHDMSWAPNVVKTCMGVGEKKPDQIGARRVLNGVFHATLLELSDLDHTFKYSIDDGPSPVSKREVKGYVGIVHVLPITDNDTSFVEWTATWEARDNAAEKFCHGIYAALLGDLKKRFE